MVRDVLLRFFVLAVCIALANFECLQESYEDANIVPHIIKEVPDEELVVYFGEDKLSCGDEIKRSVTDTQPTLEYSYEDDELYTLIMIDPDAPFPEDPSFQHYLHWLVINIPGCNVDKGEVVMEYMPSAPPKKSDPHRYIFLLYKQPKRTTLKVKKRPKFNLRRFVEKNNLEGPVSGNFYFTRAD